MSLFRAAIQKYGQPLRIRTDCGSENVDIWRNMIDMYGETSNSVVVSSSAHNQRLNATIGPSMNRSSMCLNTSFTNWNIKEYCLHYIYTPRLNQSLSEFIAAHNHVSTEENLSPLPKLPFYQSSMPKIYHRESRACSERTTVVWNDQYPTC